jgi:hypothetical protein
VYFKEKDKVNHHILKMAGGGGDAGEGVYVGLKKFSYKIESSAHPRKIAYQGRGYHSLLATQYFRLLEVCMDLLIVFYISYIFFGDQLQNIPFAVPKRTEYICISVT